MGAVGVVMAAFNSERWIAASLESLQSQTETTWSCVVVDDGSTDSTASIVERIAVLDARIALVPQANKGVAAARNLGLRHLAGAVEELLFLDSDDLLLPDAIAALADRLASRPDAVGVFGLAEYIDEAGNAESPGIHSGIQRARRTQRGFRFTALPAGEDSTFADIALYGPIWPSAVGLHRRAAVEAVGGFDPAVRLLSDWDLYLKMSRLGPFAMIDRQVAWYRRHNSNLTSDPVANTTAHTAVVHRAWHDANNTPAQRRLIGRGWWLIRAGETLVLGRAVLGELRRGHLRRAARTCAAFLVAALTLTRVRPPRP
jgi:glycosyltransferase involved in cell wall biosynthesis